MRSSVLRKSPDHPSFKAHTRQVWWQIVLPVLLAGLVLMALVLLWAVPMGGTGDVARWGQISTMWLLIPVMLASVLFLAVVIALILVVVRINDWLPTISYRAQRLASTASSGTRRAAEMIRRPVLALKAAGDMARTGLKRLRGGF